MYVHVFTHINATGAFAVIGYYYHYDDDNVPATFSYYWA